MLPPSPGSGTRQEKQVQNQGCSPVFCLLGEHKSQSPRALKADQGMRIPTGSFGSLSCGGPG